MNLTKNQQLLLRGTSDCYMVGTIAFNEEFYPNIGEDTNEPITIMKNCNNVVFFIKALNEEPKVIKECINNNYISNLYIGVDSQQNENFLGTCYNLNTDNEKKIEIIQNKLKDKLIIFNPNVNIKDDNIYKNVKIISLENNTEFNIEPSDKFIPVPQLRMGNDFDSWIERGLDINLSSYNNLMDKPRYIICNDYIFFNFPQWESSDNTSTKWRLKHSNEYNVKKVKFNIKDSNLSNFILRCTNDLIFIKESFFDSELWNKMQSQIIESNENIDLLNNTIKEPYLQSSQNTCATTNRECCEAEFLDAFKCHTINEQLCYSKDDLVNFHISAKTNPLTILAGQSGTGKTQLALAYADMLSLSEKNKNLLIVPINPSYTEPGDILGYLNTTNGLFIPSETGLTDFLVHAEKHSNEMHMIIFDEMNLSQVEHWFAPFISLLELKIEQRTLKLYGNAICHNDEKYPSSINIGNNLIFVGTVNMDETTKEFSDRLLDRANVVSLKKQTFIELKNEQNDINLNCKDYNAYKCNSKNQYVSWLNKKQSSLDAYRNNELEFLDELHELIQKYDNQKGVSFRIFDNIGSYLNNIPVDNKNEYLISRKVAFDIQIKQRLLTKIKGTEQQYEKLIGTANKDSDEPYDSELYNFFNSDNAKEVSDFIICKKEILRKAKELSTYGYAN